MRLAPRGVNGFIAGAVLITLAAGAARADQVTGLTAFHRSGQTFLTWTSPPGTGWIYRVYASGVPIVSDNALRSARMVGAVGDSTWYDRRLSALTGTIYSFRVDSLAPPLDPTNGLYVHTPDGAATTYYAVTAQRGPLLAEDRTLVVDGNTLLHAVRERPDPPDLVFQRVLPNKYVAPAIYTLWTSDQGTSDFPAMSNIPSNPYDCAVTPRGPAGSNPLLVGLHARGGNFLQGIYGTGHPGEWVLSLDDPLFNADANTFWFGYHESYDITSDTNLPPVDGVVHDYTMRRVIYSLEWAERRFSIDRGRVYGYGFSMGGIGSLLLAMRRPDLIAAVMTVAAKVDFSFLNDPVPTSGFNLGNGLRQTTDKLWGAVETDLPSSDGVSIYSALNDGWVAGQLSPSAVPPILAFNGKNDIVVGWAEKLPFYRDMRTAHQGGYFFWDMRDHLQNADAPWSPAQDSWYLYRFRSDRSFPALSNCSVDNDPGDGNPTVGDSIGCINCWVEWDTTVVDRNVDWSTRLWTRDLPRTTGWVTGPDSVVVDVTPRRLQQFRVVQGASYHYTVTRESDGAVLRSGALQPDAGSLLTLTQVPVYKTGTTVRFEALGALAVETPRGGPLHLALSRNPLDGPAAVELSWPAAGMGRVVIMDVSGRIVRTLLSGPVAAGPVHLPVSIRGLGDGVYFVVATQGRERATVRAVVLH